MEHCPNCYSLMADDVCYECISREVAPESAGDVAERFSKWFTDEGDPS